MLEATCTNLEKVRVNYRPINASGGDALVDGPLRCEIINGDGSWIVDPLLPLQVQYLSGDEEGIDVEFDVIGDADMGAGVIEIRDRFVLHIAFQKATSFGGEVLAPELK